MSDPTSDPTSDPGRILREGLERISQEVETAVPFGPRVRAARRRRTRRAVGAAALAVLVVAGGGALLLRQHGAAPVATAPPAAPPSQQAPAVAGGYRLEVWQDVGVYVPATWGWGGAPKACGVGPHVGADGHRLTGTEPLAGYVGRPIDQVSPCSKSTLAESGMPYLWLGADVPVGTVDLGGGWVQETRKVAGTTVTVASDDADLRVGILSSAHRIKQATCPASLALPPTPSSRGSGRFEPVSLTVCAYAPAVAGETGYRLLYDEDLAPGPAKQLVDAVAAAKPMGEYSCYGASGGEWVLLHLTGSGSQSRDYVVDMSCPSIADASGEQHRLTSADVLPWAVDGVNAVLHANPLIDVPGRFIGR
jgi:hypothetical protein